MMLRLCFYGGQGRSQFHYLLIPLPSPQSDQNVALAPDATATTLGWPQGRSATEKESPKRVPWAAKLLGENNHYVTDLCPFSIYLSAPIGWLDRRGLACRTADNEIDRQRSAITSSYLARDHVARAEVFQAGIVERTHPPMLPVVLRVKALTT